MDVEVLNAEEDSLGRKSIDKLSGEGDNVRWVQSNMVMR